MLTVTKLNNFLIYWVLFKISTDIISDNVSYIVEKFNLFFKNPPDINSNLFTNLHWNTTDIWNKGTEYIIRWGLDLNEFINTDEYPIWLFTHYIIHSEKEKNELLEQYIMDDGDVNIPKTKKTDIGILSLLIIYKKFFKSYESISDEKGLERILHPILRKEYEEFVNKHKTFFRNVLINQLIK